MEKGLIIFLNGTSSSGKSSIANSLIELSDLKLVHLSVDDLALLYTEWFNNKLSHLNGVSEESNQNFLNIIINPLASFFHSTIKGMSELGANVIVDHVAGTNKDWLYECITLLDGHPVVFVGVKCSLDELERREKARGDRQLGLARSQYETIHSYGEYDIEVNTEELTPEQCAKQILDQVAASQKSAGFQRLKEKAELTAASHKF